MAIFALRQIVNVNAPADNCDLIGFSLYLASFAHFTNFLGQVGLAFGYNSCNAAVAIQNHADYEGLAAAGLNFSVLYGTSRLYAGLDPDFNAIHGGIAPTRPFSNSLAGEHAEQTAIRIVDAAPALNFINHGGHFHLYVDLNPCPNCTNWLNADPRNWFVHYRANLAVQGPLVKEKREMRKTIYGKYMEKRMQRRGIVKPAIVRQRRRHPRFV